MNVRQFLSKYCWYYLLVGALMVGSSLGFSHAITAAAQQELLKSQVTIVLDPGHGGEDGGAISCTGVAESQINLEISLRIHDLLHLLGYNTTMIRDTDTSVYTQGDTISQRKVSDLKERVRRIQETKDAMLVSIHQNQFSDSQYNGAQVFYAGETSSKSLAQAMQTALVEKLNPGSRRQCKKAEGIYLMQHIDCPGILIECGFLSNPEEEVKLRSERYQKMLSCVISATLAQFLQQNSLI